MNHNPDMKILIIISILIILFIGIFIRFDSVGLDGVSSQQKDYYIDQNGQQYMYDMDSYYNYRLSENFLLKGSLEETNYQGKSWDTKSYYPPGVPLDYPPLIAYISVFIYIMINLIHPIQLINVCFWVPAIIAPLAGILGFIFIYRIKKGIIGVIGGFTTGILIVTSPFYFMRTVPGFFDTDMFNLIFPILTTWLLFEALNTEKQIKQCILTILASLSMLLFSFAWNGWQFLYYIILISVITFLVIKVIKKFSLAKLIKGPGKILIFFLVLSLILVLIINGFSNFFKIIYAPLEVLKITSTHSLWSPWPDPYVFINELQPPSFLNFIWGTGPGIIIFGFLGLITLFILTIKKNNLKLKVNNNSMQFLFILLFFWTFLSILSLQKGIRFEIILIAPLSLSAGIFIEILWNFLENNLKFDQKKQKSQIVNKWISSNLPRYLLIFLLIVLITLPSVLIVESNNTNLVPRANDDLWASAIWIKDNTPPNTVVISNWVHGHFFAAVANRSVNFDGRLGYIETIPVRNWDYKNTGMDTRIPNVYREYWQDKALSTSNFTLAQGIFQMISTSGDQAYLTLLDYTHDHVLSVEILNNTLGIDKDSAYIILTEKYEIPHSTAQKVLNYTHPTNPKPYILVTYDSLIEKGYWIFYYGNWNFKEENGTKPIYSYGNLVRNENKNRDLIVTDDNTTINLKVYTATWNGQNPNKLIIIKNNQKEEKNIDKKSNFDIFYIPEKNKTVILEKKYENSVFVKLILENKDNNEFKIVYKKGSVYLWENNF